MQHWLNALAVYVVYIKVLSELNGNHFGEQIIIIAFFPCML